MNLTVDEMLRLARRVYPGFTFYINDYRVGDDGNVYGIFGGDQVRFNPKLDGINQEKAQALDCIVAAENSPQHQQYRDHVANGMPAFQAAISALLGKEQS